MEEINEDKPLDYDPEDTNFADEEVNPKEHVYQPEDDTFLLEDAALEFAKGKVLEVGCGSGHIIVSMAKEGHDSFACDINSHAVEETKKLALSEGVKVEVVESDLFGTIMDEFDTIIFNPPYLPEDDDEPYDDIRLATTGGKEGYEVIGNFLQDLPVYLKDDGLCLLLFSSLTKKDVVDELIGACGFEFELVREKSIFFETLYVYKLTKKN